MSNEPIERPAARLVDEVYDMDPATAALKIAAAAEALESRLARNERSQRRNNKRTIWTFVWATLAVVGMIANFTFRHDFKVEVCEEANVRNRGMQDLADHIETSFGPNPSESQATFIELMRDRFALRDCGAIGFF